MMPSDGSIPLGVTPAEPAVQATKGVVIYDANCPLCHGIISRFNPILTRHGWGCLPLQHPLAPTLSSRSVTQLQRAITVCPHHAPSCQGVDALVLILNGLPRTRALLWCLEQPRLKPFWEWGYRLIARHRHAISRIWRV